MEKAIPVLIISFKFPPLGGVGTKRQTKFAKYLANLGYEVHVLTTNHKNRGGNNWEEDIDDSKITVHRVPSRFPHDLYYRQFSRSFTDRLINKVRTKMFRAWAYFFLLDGAQYWGRALLPAAEQLIRTKEITNIVATGAPFNVNYMAALLKKRNPQINLINDWQDPWNDNPFLKVPEYFPFQWQKRRSEMMEEFALKNSDMVTTVTESWLELLKGRANGSHASFRVIPNGFDPAYFRDLARKPESGKMVMCYIGNLFAGREKGFTQFLKAVLELTISDEAFRDRFLLKVYGGFPYGIDVDYARLVGQGNLKIIPRVPPREALQAAKNSFLLLLINAEEFPGALSAKVYEYIAVQRPILAIAPEGELSKLIDSYNLGDHVRVADEARIKEVLARWFGLWREDPLFEVDLPEESVNQFSEISIAEQLADCFR